MNEYQARAAMKRQELLEAYTAAVSHRGGDPDNFEVVPVFDTEGVYVTLTALTRTMPVSGINTDPVARHKTLLDDFLILLDALVCGEVFIIIRDVSGVYEGRLFAIVSTPEGGYNTYILG
jgi:hypothetical protein